MEGRWGQRTSHQQVPLVPELPKWSQGNSQTGLGHFSTGEDESVFQSFYGQSPSTSQVCKDQDGAVNQTKPLPWDLELVGGQTIDQETCYHIKVL